MPNKKKSQTLIEVVISVALAVMVISALLVLGAASSKTVASSLRRTQATKLATDKVEEARYIRDQFGYDNVVADFTSGNVSLPATESVEVGSNTYTRTVTITTNTDPAYKAITVMVKWDETAGSQSTKSVTIPTILSDWK